MRNKFFKVISVAVLFISLLGQANAGLIVGGIYENSAGEKWKYVGSFDMALGPIWNDADGLGIGTLVTPLNGLEVAASRFGLPTKNLAVSAFSGISQVYFDSIQEGQDVVNHLAWYDGNISAISRLPEDIVADIDNDGSYEPYDLYDGDNNRGDVSAYVDDRGVAFVPGNDIEFSNINYVFKAVEVSEPSTLGLFALVLCGLGALRFKKT
jgi:hypothetical protein